MKLQNKNFFKLKQKLLSFFLLIILFSGNSISQDESVKVKAVIDSSNYLIGDQIHLKLIAELTSGIKLKFPEISDSLGKLLVIGKSKIDTVKNNKVNSLTQVLTLTSFDSGYYQIPSLEFNYYKADTNRFSAFTDPINVKYTSVSVDTTKPIKDIKPPLEVPFSIWDYIWYIVGIIGFVFIVLVVIYYFYKRKPQQKEIRNFDPKIPPHVQALLDFEKLEEEKLWQQGKIKDYYSRLTDILRLYLERRFDFPALELTTSEIMIQIKMILSGSEILINLQKILDLADLVKFAKNIPIPQENTLAISLSRNIVESTIPIETDAEKKGEQYE